MRQFTFWHANDTSEHVSLRYHKDGTIRHLSRDGNHSVRPVWNAIGRHWDANGTKHFAFFRIVPHLWVAATLLNHKGAVVHGAQMRPLAWIKAQATTTITDPDTLMKRNRKRSTERGEDYAGERGACQFRVNGRHSVDVNDMHDAIEARWAARKSK